MNFAHNVAAPHPDPFFIIRGMSDEQSRDEAVKLLTDAVNKALDQRRSVDEKTHARHHEFIARRIEHYDRTAQRREKLINHVLGWSAIAAIGVVVSGVGAAIRDWLQRGAQ